MLFLLLLFLNSISNLNEEKKTKTIENSYCDSYESIIWNFEMYCVLRFFFFSLMSYPI